MKVYPCFRKIVVVIIALPFLFFLGCSNNRSKKKFFVSGVVCKNLTVEKYIVGSWGALSAETYSDYLTDSINFRVFVGIHGDENNFAYACTNDSVYVIRLSQIGVEKAKVVDTLKVYSLSELKRKKIFE
jgi:hypothetical protein